MHSIPASLLRITLLSLPVCNAWAQTPAARISVDAAFAGLTPLSGWKAEEYSTGPAIRAGAEVRFSRYFSADAGWTSAWIDGLACSRYGCEHPTYRTGLIDYGVRGILPLAQGRIEISLGAGGGYIRYGRMSGDEYYNGSLFQYSGKASVALNHSGSLRLIAGVRTWRDLGRPIQQWLSPSIGISCGLGHLK